MSSWVVQNLGLTMLTVICLALTVYLIYSMVHPEQF
ncbi:MAG TPA: potassium-transporting ATPase subunit F [Thermoplasmata archaeon]|nr:potassium-transporting ATPase subunit F [Thermoplasmata archaeon]